VKSVFVLREERAYDHALAAGSYHCYTEAIERESMDDENTGVGVFCILYPLF
jgi:hypothetical protein